MWNPPDPPEFDGTPYEQGYAEGFIAGELAAMERIGRNVEELYQMPSGNERRNGLVRLFERLLQSVR